MSAVAPSSVIADWLSLDQPAAQDVARAGSKGAGLARLRHAGFPVPPGFVVPAELVALQEARLSSRLASVDAGTISDAECERLQGEMAAQPPIEALAACVHAGYATLLGQMGTSTRVAVRSSGVAEDLPDASFAGQYDTFLSVESADAALSNVMRCIASRWSPRAVRYRAAHRGSPAGFAVIVQVQVDGEISGVLFTANPMRPGVDEFVISAARGLGEAVVSGTVTPERVVTDRHGSIREHVAAGGGGECQLGAAEIHQLVKMGRAIEAFAGSPQDIEWTLASRKVVLLQARPITTLADARLTAAFPLSRGQITFLRRSPMLANFMDHFPDPLTALDFTTVARAGLAGIAATAAYLGFRMRPVEQILPTTPAGHIVFQPGPPRPTWRVMLLPWRLFQIWRLDARREWERVDWPLIEQVDRRMPPIDPETASTRAMLDRIRALQLLFETASRNRFRKYFLTGLLHQALLTRLIRVGVGRERAEAYGRRLHLAIEYSTSAANAELTEIARSLAASPAKAAELSASDADAAWQQIQRDPALAPLAERIRAFLLQYGARTVSGMVPVPSHATWAEHPAVVVGLLQALVRGGAASNRDADRRSFEEARAFAQARLGRGWRGLLRLDRLFERSLDQTRAFVAIREAGLQRGERGIAAGRQATLALGARLHQAGQIDAVDDVFHLRLEELDGIVNGTIDTDILRRRITVRKAQHERWTAAARRGEPWVHLAIGLPPRLVRAASRDGNSIRGIAASPGQARGIARVIHDHREFHTLRPGEILVCPATAPAWTPLFTIARAVVTDVGGPLSHAGIVARELGIPAVMGTGRATVLIRDGQTILVDGSAGTVHVD